jgi:multiple sugar transport system permease protein
MSESTQTLPATRRAPRPSRTLRPSRREAIWGYIFVSPWLIGLALFTIGPIVASFALSLTNFDMLHTDETRFIGLDNYVRMAADPLVAQALAATFKFAIIVIPVTMIASLGFALLLNHPKVVARGALRTLVYMPMMIPLVASTLVWIGFLNTETGWLNKGIEALGLPAPDWINSEAWIYPALTLMGLWAIGNFMLINIAGLQSVPTELYESARIDGAGWWTQLRRITIPLMSPVLLYDLVIVLIATFQYFTQAFTMTNGRGDPNNATLFINLNLFREAFVFSRMGYGSAIAWLLFAIVLVLTGLLFWLSSKRVYYAGGER